MDTWVPQVSSKYVGLEADGIIYDEISILQNHGNLVDRYSPTRVALLYSSDYSTFRNDDFWVSIALEPFSTPEGANGWCDQMGIPPDHLPLRRVAAILTGVSRACGAGRPSWRGWKASLCWCPVWGRR